MKFGIHLPQFGRAAGPDSIRKAAIEAEQQGYDDIWVSDHLAVPADAPYPPTAYIYEPLVSLTWAAAATTKIGLGTSVLVLPLRHPLVLAKMLATLDLLSGGRLTVGAAVGWLEEEFDALGVPFKERGKRGDETIEMMRACWTEDPVDGKGNLIAAEFKAMRVLPQPSRPIPIWVGGHAEPAFQRAVRRGDGWHGSRKTPEEAAPIVKRLRADRPEESFTLSLRLNWDALVHDNDDLRRQLDAYRKIGIQHVMFQPNQRHAEDWLRSAEMLLELAKKTG
jgi:probable F420-dependent oxidoreductase